MTQDEILGRKTSKVIDGLSTALKSVIDRQQAEIQALKSTLPGTTSADKADVSILELVLNKQ